MRFVMFFFLLVVFFSSAELLLLLKVAANLGFLATFLLCAGSGILGGALVRAQGLQTLRDIQTSIAKGILPTEEIVSGFIIILSGAMLMLPGFITDTLGFLMLVPPLRRVVARLILAQITVHIRMNVNVGTPGHVTPEPDEEGIETKVESRSASPEE